MATRQYFLLSPNSRGQSLRKEISVREEIEVIFKKEFSSSVAINSLENGKQLLRQMVLNQGVQKLQLCCHCYAVR